MANIVYNENQLIKVEIGRKIRHEGPYNYKGRVFSGPFTGTTACSI